MKEIKLPEAPEQQQKKCASLRRTGIFFSVCTMASAVAAILSLLATFVVLVVFSFREDLASSLMYILIGCLGGGAVALALAAFGLNILSQRHYKRELDLRERRNGAESFFVGEGTLATFGEKGVTIHGEGQGGREISVPYSEMRFFSVCTRRAPKEKGEWSVVLEIPARYLSKERAPKKEEGAPALVQTDAKPRLYQTLEAHGLTLLGEKQREGSEKFTRLARFVLPNRKKRKGALITLGVAVAAIAAGVVAAALWEPVVGAGIGAVALLFAVRAVIAFVRAKGVLGMYREGLYWQESDRADSVFLKWEEIVRIERLPNNGFELYRVQCAYGAYHFPAVAGSYEVLKASHPEKWEEETCAS